MVLLYDNVGNCRFFMSLFQSFKKIELSSIINDMPSGWKKISKACHYYRKNIQLH